MSNAPAYQMYAGDWLKSRAVRLMTDYQRGWYIQLLNEAWDGSPQCMLPDDDELLQVLAGVSDLTKAQPDFNDRWNTVKRLFVKKGDYVYNERQMSELAGQKVRREKAVLAGQASAKSREAKRKAMQKAKAELLRKGNGRSTDVQSEFNINPTLLSPSSSPSSDSNLQPTVKNTMCDESHVPPLKSARDYTADFERFWKVYPSATNKAKAFDAWKAKKCGPHVDKLIADVERQKRESDKWQKGIIPHGATWINNARWEDVFEGAKPTSTSEDAEMEARCKKVIEEESERIIAEYAIPEVSE